MWEDYDVPGGTLRENIYGEGQKYLRDDHYGHKFKYPSDFQGDTAIMADGKEDLVNGSEAHETTNGVAAPSKKVQVSVNEKTVQQETV